MQAQSQTEDCVRAQRGTDTLGHETNSKLCLWNTVLLVVCLDFVVISC